MKKTLGKMLTNTCDAYVIPENYMDYVFDGYFDPSGLTGCPSWIPDLEIVEDAGILSFTTKNASIHIYLEPGNVIVYDTNKFIEDVVAVFNSIDDAQEYAYIPGIID